jgi:CheY-like chemotaxis protein
VQGGKSAGATTARGDRRARVLVVDDDAGVRGMMLIYLKHLGYAGDTVAGGREALDAVASGIYDLVLMDYTMPEMDGVEACRRIRRMEIPGGQPGIVAFTSQAGLDTRANCLAAGMDGFLLKPFTEEEIRAALEGAMGDRVPRAWASAEGTKRIILVDDDASVRQFLWEALTLAGYEVVQVASGADARWLVEDEPRPYDLLVVDVVMPGMTGPEFAKWLHAAHPSTRILFVTGYDEDTARKHGLPEGVEVLQKPFSADALLRRVAAALRAVP